MPSHHSRRARSPDRAVDRGRGVARLRVSRRNRATSPALPCAADPAQPAGTAGRRLPGEVTGRAPPLPPCLPGHRRRAQANHGNRFTPCRSTRPIGGSTTQSCALNFHPRRVILHERALTFWARQVASTRRSVGPFLLSPRGRFTAEPSPARGRFAQIGRSPMSAAIATLSSLSLRDVHSQFVAALPAIEKVLRFELRRVPKQARADAFADALAATWAAWRSLVQRGKDPLQVGPTGIAARCCLGTRAGRKVGNMNSGRGCLDVHDHRAQRRLGLTVHNPDEPDEFAVGASSEVWRECVAEDNRVSPADEAAFHVDFEVWLAGLPRRSGEMAELLAAKAAALARSRVCSTCRCRRSASRARGWRRAGASSRANRSRRQRRTCVGP